MIEASAGAEADGDDARGAAPAPNQRVRFVGEGNSTQICVHGKLFAANPSPEESF